MIPRRCSNALKRPSAEVTAALAQLPAFLVPSFADALRPPVPPPPKPRKIHTHAANSSGPFQRPSLRFVRLPSTLSARPLDCHRYYASVAARPAHASPRVVTQLEVETQHLAPEPRQDYKGKGKASSFGAEDLERQEAEEEEAPAVADARASEDRSERVDRELSQLVADLRPDATRKQLLDARNRIKAHNRLDDARLVKRVVSVAIGQKCYDVALRLLNEAANLMLARRSEHRRGVAWMYVDAAQHLGRLRRWDFVVEVTNQALHKGLVTPLLLHSRMRGLNRRSRFVDTIATFDLYERHGFPPDGPAFDEVIEAHLLNADLPTAQAALAEKGHRGFPTTAQTCLTLFDGMALYGGNKIMEEKVLRDEDEQDLADRTAVRQDVRVLNKIMSVRAGRDAARDALAILDYYDLEHYPAGLFDRFRQLALPSSDAVSPLVVEHWRPRPDRATIVTLIGIALRYRRPDLATDLLSSSVGRSFHLNDHLASSITRILITEGSISAAEEFVFALPAGRAQFRNFTYPRFVPGSFVYESLLTGILRFRGLAGVNECFRRMTEAKLPPLKVSEGLTRALVDYLALEKMQKLGVSADILLKVKEITQGRTKPTRENLNTLLKAAWMSERLSLHEWTKMRKAIENEFPIPAADAGAKAPPRRPLPPIAKLLARTEFDSPRSSRRMNALARIRDSLVDRGVRHSGETAVHVLRNDHLIRFISAKWDYLQAQVLDLGVRPTHDHFTVLIRAYLVLGDIQGAVLALRYALAEAKIDPHVALYSTMISGLSRLGRHDLALTMYEELRETPGVEPDRQLFAALAMSCSRLRDIAGLERILEEVATLVNHPIPGKNVDPSFLEQAQVQAQSRARLGRAHGDDGGARAAVSYDPLLDPFFVTIYYRTLNVLGRHADAQAAMKGALDRGLVPDRIVWQVLDRTGAWMRWKDNRARRDGTTASSGGDRAEAKATWEDNFRRVRTMMRPARPAERDHELRAIEMYWEKAERSDVDDKEWADFFRDTSSRRANRNGPAAVDQHH
ncbi:hypothetical protein JCM11491_002247 [Sporobolomyces phaffii]